MTVELKLGDCLEVLRALPDCSVDAVVTDPPYGLAFMGKKWDYDVPSEEVWRECLRVLKPGGHLLAFAGTRTQHRMAVRIEDAGFQIRDMIAWVYGSGFPKSLDVSKAIDRMKYDRHEIEQVVRWMEETRQRTAVTRKQVEDRFGTINIGQALFTITPGSTPRVPTLEQVDVLLDLFGLTINDVPDDIHRLLIEKNASKGQPGPNWFKREVVGHRKRGFAPNTNAVYGDYSGDTRLTAPATDAARQWDGWGTALKPALEPITVARKPLVGTVAANVLAHGCGGINVDGCRVAHVTVDGGSLANNPHLRESINGGNGGHIIAHEKERRSVTPHAAGRWPANLIHDGSDEVVGLFPNTTSGSRKAGRHVVAGGQGRYGEFAEGDLPEVIGDSGSAARFFYCAKASKADRGDNHHPTVKPTALMRYLCRLVTPPNGIVLDPFMGSGSTGKAAMLEGFGFIGIERESEYLEIARARIEAARNDGFFCSAT